jgi:hypothetical protein
VWEDGCQQGGGGARCLPAASPVVSGPKHQIFLATSLSQPNSSDRILERSLGSSRGPTLPSSIASARPSSRGRACSGAAAGHKAGVVSGC